MRRWLLPGVAVLALAGCGGDDSQTFVAPPPASDPARLYGTWTATQPGGYKLRYEFHPDGTYRHSSGVRQKRPGGVYRYLITARGKLTVRGSTLVLRPLSGTQERHDPADPEGDYKRPIRKLRQRYEWSVRGSGRRAQLTMTIGGGLAVRFRPG